MRTGYVHRATWVPDVVFRPSKAPVVARTMPTSAFASAYGDALKELTSTELAKIKLLRDLAKENKNEAANVVDAINSHILKCPPQHRLPALYLVDCVLKSADAPYPELLAGVITRMFGFVWDNATPDLRIKLVKTAGTWNDHLPAEVMATITLKMQPPQPSQQFQPQVAQPPQQSILFYPGAPGGYPPAPQYMYSSTTGQPLLVAPISANVAATPGLAPGLSTYGGVLLPAAAPVATQTAQLATLPVSQPAQPAVSNISALLLSKLAQQLSKQQQSSTAGAGGGSSGGGTVKDSAQAAVDALFTASATTRSKFLDLQFLRNKRLQAGTQLRRLWYVKVDQWLEGTRAQDESSAHFFEEQAVATVTLPPVEEDPSQPNCAISGEAFTRTYDPDTDKWFYEDAVVLTAEQAAAYGVMEGSIVKTSCLAGAPPPVLKGLGLQPTNPRASPASTPADGTGSYAVSASYTLSAGKRVRAEGTGASATVLVTDKRVRVDG